MRTFRATFLATLFGTFGICLCFGAQTGQVLGWGIDTEGQATGVSVASQATGFVQIAGQTLTNVTAISAGRSHALALKSNGTVIGWGANGAGQTTPPRINGQILSDVIAISAGDEISLALKGDGTVTAWGSNLRHGLDVPQGLGDVLAISAGWTHCLAIKRDGTVVGWGSPGAITGLTNIIAVVAGRSWHANNLALTEDGTVIEWGPNGVATAVPNEVSNVVAIAAGDNFSLALLKDGTVVGWGANGDGQATGKPTAISPYQASGKVEVGGQILTDVIKISAGNEYGLALKADGTVVKWGRKQQGLPDVPIEAKGIIAVAAGESFCLAITTNSGALKSSK